MRIVGGKHKGRALAAPKGRDTRPTSDRAREAMFNVLEHGVDGRGLAGARVIDVFAGTGALGLEALSRGAKHVLFVESHRGALEVLKDNIRTLRVGDDVTVMPIKAQALPTNAGLPVSYAFLDAPYHKNLTAPALTALATRNWLADGAVVMAEVAADEVLDLPDGFTLVKEKAYGAARALFLTYIA